MTDEIQSQKTGLCYILSRIMRLITHLSNTANYIYHAYPPSEEVESNLNGPATNEFLHFPDVRARGLRSDSDPKERDTALALLYTFSRLLKTMLEAPADPNEDTITEVQYLAIALCRLCASFPGRSSQTMMGILLIKRSLLWAGLILTKSKFPSGDTHFLQF